MTQTQHTPGPWTVKGPSHIEGRAEFIANTDRIIGWTANTFMEDADDREDADIGGGVTTGEDRANARLIAAAPQLLEALKMLRLMDERDLRPESCCGPTKLAVIKQADAAIKAATEG